MGSIVFSVQWQVQCYTKETLSTVGPLHQLKIRLSVHYRKDTLVCTCCWCYCFQIVIIHVAVKIVSFVALWTVVLDTVLNLMYVCKLCLSMIESFHFVFIVNIVVSIVYFVFFCVVYVVQHILPNTTFLDGVHFRTSRTFVGFAKIFVVLQCTNYPVIQIIIFLIYRQIVN